MDLAVKLEIFEGPLDLLLHLIRKNEVDIYDIPIALITSQYLEYLEVMRELNIQIAGDFLVMASTLTHIKSRMLLPSHDPADDEDDGDPRLDLVAQLKEHMRIQAAAEKLENRLWMDRDVFKRAGGKQEVDSAVARAGESEIIEAGLFELIEAFRRLAASGSVQPDWNMPVARISLEDRMSQVLDRLKRKSSLAFEEFFQDGGDKAHLVVTFLALLELTRVGLIRLYQQRRAESSDRQAAWGTLRIQLNDLADDEETDR